MTSVKIAWLAGIIEGEGYFSFSDSNSPLIKVKMTDEDVIKRISVLFKRPYYEEKVAHGNKRAYRVAISGNPAIGWMLTIYSLMSYRRQLRIREVIEEWKNERSYSKTMFSCGHFKTKENTLIKGRYTACKTCAYESARRFKLRKTNALKSTES